MRYGKVEEITLFSKELNEDVQILVSLPYNYTPFSKYKVLIVSDGKDYIQYGRVGRVIDELIEDGEIEDVIFFGIPYKSVQERREMYHPDGPRKDSYIRFLAHELVPYIDEHYPTHQVGSCRALMGDSLAATISLLTALQYPNMFGDVILHSPFINDDVLNKVKKAENAASLNIYHIIGTGETSVKTLVSDNEDFLTPNRALHDVISNMDFSYFYEEFDGNHTWKYWQKDIKRAIQKTYAY